MDKERIISLLDQLDSYVKDLKLHKPNTLKLYERNLEKRRFCERTLQLAIEVCMDIGQLLIKDLKLGLPNDEDTIFDKLKRENIISERMMNILKSMKRFRNVLIHKYVDIDDEMVFNNVKNNLHDFKMFKRELSDYLKKK